MNTSAPRPDAAAFYDSGQTPVFAAKCDPRFSYCLYVPPRQDRLPTEIVVAMHGTGRAFADYRDWFSAFGKWNNCIILAPLFPAGVFGDRNLHGFKHLRERNIRYDEVLIAIVDEVREQFAVTRQQFGLFGYSGGGQFVNRFLLVHPQRLWSASIGAPGSVSLIDATRDWWVGTRDLARQFGCEVDIEAIRRVPVQMIVGEADLETWEITHVPGGRAWMPDANHAGRTRPERLASLRQSFEEQGIAVRFDLVANMAHEARLAVPYVEDFFADALDRLRMSDAK